MGRVIYHARKLVLAPAFANRRLRKIFVVGSGEELSSKKAEERRNKATG